LPFPAVQQQASNTGDGGGGRLDKSNDSRGCSDRRNNNHAVHTAGWISAGRFDAAQQQSPFLR